jgi:hypothetical protein
MDDGCLTVQAPAEYSKCPPTTTTAGAVCHLTTITCHPAIAEWATLTRKTSRQEVETDIINRNNIQVYTRHTLEFFIYKNNKFTYSLHKSTIPYFLPHVSAATHHLH